MRKVKDSNPRRSRDGNRFQGDLHSLCATFHAGDSIRIPSPLTLDRMLTGTSTLKIVVTRPNAPLDIISNKYNQPDTYRACSFLLSNRAWDRIRTCEPYGTVCKTVCFSLLHTHAYLFFYTIIP